MAAELEALNTAPGLEKNPRRRYNEADNRKPAAQESEALSLQRRKNMSVKLRALIIDGDTASSSLMSSALTACRYATMTVHDGEAAFKAINSYCPDIILLELALPDMDGLRFLRIMREWSNVPLIVVSSRRHERDIVEALDLGADDYVTKPFGTAELMARIRAALRHHERADGGGGAFETGELKIDYDRRCVTLSGERIRLTPNEYKILSLMSKYSGKVLTYDYIIREIWGSAACGDNRILRVNMANIRRKIEKDPSKPEYIFTENGVGYRIREEK